MDKTQVLLIVDMNPLSSSIKNLLELENWIDVVGVTEDQNEALDLADKFSPDVVIIDFDLKEEGLKTGAMILEKKPETKIIALSIYDYIGNVKVKTVTPEESKMVAACSWISKKSSPVALIDSIAGARTRKNPN